MELNPYSKIIQQLEIADKTVVLKGALSDGVWMGLHKVQHTFIDSDRALFSMRVITQPHPDLIMHHIACLNKNKFTSDNAKGIINLLHTGASYYDQHEIEGVGEMFA